MTEQPTKSGKPYPLTEQYLQDSRHLTSSVSSAAREAARDFDERMAEVQRVTSGPVPRDPGCSHPARQRLSRDGDVITERCRLCDVVLVTDRSTSTIRTEVTGR